MRITRAHIIRLRFCTSLCGWLLLGSAALCAEEQIISRFDSLAELASWKHAWGVPTSLTLDSTQDAGEQAASGALRVACSFAAATEWQGSAIQYSFMSPIDASRFGAIAFDVRVDPSSALRLYRDYAVLEAWMVESNGAHTKLPGQFYLTKTNWGPVLLPFDSVGNRESMRGIVLSVGGGEMKGVVELYLDRVRLTTATKPEPATQPSTRPNLMISPATSGVELFASQDPAYAGPWQDQAISTRTSGHSWVGRPAPVSYSMTVTGMPEHDLSRHGAETLRCQMVLVGNATNPSGQFEGESNVIALLHYGTLGVEVRYKVNAPGQSIWSNPRFLGHSGLASPLGTFSAIFHGTDVTLRWPNQGSAIAQFPSAVLKGFDKSVHVFLGVSTDGYGQQGQSATISRFEIQGLDAPFVETFANLDRWTTSVSPDPAGIVLRPMGTNSRVSWNSEYTDFALQECPDLVGGQWSATALQVLTVGNLKVAYPATTSVHAATFYRLGPP